MNQPPKPDTPPQWRRPSGVSPGTWAYVNERTIADHYDAFVADTPLCHLDVQILRDQFPVVGAKSETVLDLGCGSGRTAIPLAALGYDVVGVDLSASMLEVLIAKASTLPSGSGRISGVKANLVQLECFADRSADHAVCLFSTMGMIQGRTNRRRVFAHVARILRPGGRFLIHVHNRWAALREPRGIRTLTESWIRSVFDHEHEFGDAIYSYRGIGNMFMHRFSRRELVTDLDTKLWSMERIDAVSIDGARVIQAGPLPTCRAGGFIAIARRE